MAEALNNTNTPWITIGTPRNAGAFREHHDPEGQFLNLSNQFLFSGWGSISHITLSTEDRAQGDETLQQFRRQAILGQFTASALAGNDILGGIFYTLPAIVTVSSCAYCSPISLFIATLIPFLWRPIMEELGSALPASGAPYTYLINASTKSLALVAAALLILDFASTSVVSAATAASYLAGEVTLPFPTSAGAILLLVLFTIIGLCGMKESSRIAFGVLALHLVTMAVLLIASAVQWGRVGSSLLKENWASGQAPSSSAIARDIFNGICIGMLGLTGFECAPAYIAKIRPGRYPYVLRNLHISSIILNAGTMLLVLALVPLDVILNGTNVLSILAQTVLGRWLRIWVVVDAVVVLCGGVLTGILSASELLEQLSRDRVLPQMFLKTMPFTHSPYLAVLLFSGFSAIMYASTGAQLSIISKMFSLVWLTVMTLFPLSLILLQFNRGRIPRSSKTSLALILTTFAVAITVIGGNIAIDPLIAGYSAAYFVAIISILLATQNKTRLLHWTYWAYDQHPILHKSRWIRQWSNSLIKYMIHLRRQPVCILAKTDEINYLFQMVLYVCQNEETSCLKIVHFYNEKENIPSELEANSKILDEAFPEITIDLMLVESPFDPSTVAALAHHLKIPQSLMFMSCPGVNFSHSVAEFGTRIISL
ncbi:hypothetical protein SERLADRAFT_447894 [Serpula lacrymans var. lacrymans S7.9]|uniref:AAAP amino acid permease n=1 Tax=Serpula lacrymans var. lacrymans (strain S7.9) TaxID=578457 RepID=F8NRI7_SERL9|nr:uncharacterized protein SERLADRAFT_447894 [Serpula lacrymans var. lacrymans S7.9]EGO26780.1 hypothetical protein SERLADRAFT_447894 [Serpula lacrymans var. lacrymans S7.9]